MIKYFYLDGDIKLGPFTKNELIDKNLNRDSRIWFYGLEDWTKLSDIAELKEIFSSLPPDLNTRNLQENKEALITHKNQNVISTIEVPKKKKKQK